MTNGAHKDPAKQQKHSKRKEGRTVEPSKAQVKKGTKKGGPEGG